jgi:hypothetical protein
MPDTPNYALCRASRSEPPGTRACLAALTPGACAGTSRQVEAASAAGYDHRRRPYKRPCGSKVKSSALYDEPILAAAPASAAPVTLWPTQCVPPQPHRGNHHKSGQLTCLSRTFDDQDRCLVGTAFAALPNGPPIEP